MAAAAAVAAVMKMAMSTISTISVPASSRCMAGVGTGSHPEGVTTCIKAVAVEGASLAVAAGAAAMNSTTISTAAAAAGSTVLILVQGTMMTAMMIMAGDGSWTVQVVMSSRQVQDTIGAQVHVSIMTPPAGRHRTAGIAMTRTIQLLAPAGTGRMRRTSAHVGGLFSAVQCKATATIAICVIQMMMVMMMMAASARPPLLEPACMAGRGRERQ